ncbi:hypothetical protein GOV03_02940 [Candidatus Woesearchaeota archaeon]|nr:hypothetical protein [Candidatus Woesearchaeota archaeon]
MELKTSKKGIRAKIGKEEYLKNFFWESNKEKPNRLKKIKREWWVKKVNV